jgi:hypothetical protein
MVIADIYFILFNDITRVRKCSIHDYLHEISNRLYYDECFFLLFFSFLFLSFSFNRALKYLPFSSTDCRL